MVRDLHIDLEDMILFFYVVEKGGFYKAAEALNISQPKVSRRISKLEDYFGTQLLYRSVKGVALTDSGRLILNMSRAIVENVHEIRHQVQATQTEPEGKINISVSTGFSHFWFSPLIPEFLELYPNIFINLKNNDLGDADLMLGDADIVISSSRPQIRESLECRMLCEYPVYLYASEKYLKKKPAPKTFSDFDHHDIIAWREPLAEYVSTAAFNALLSMGRSVEEPPRSARVLIENDVALVAAMASGLGLGLMPNFLGEALPGVKKIPLPGPCPLIDNFKNKKYISYPKTLKNSERHRVLIEFLERKVAESKF